ncbi:DUF5343 domain-containing protein, partial [Beijerinckia sp. L45]|uniref:DUF5343 domain-containing protein n=1 Tax=Beijerinckia sp. L45 TaxID=1641855 RepID=UPI00131B4145
LKKMAFLTSDGTPTELYAKFWTDSGRALAAVHGLRNAFPEMYKRSEYAHAVDDNKIKDIIVEITGLKPNDPVAVAIKSTFNVIRAYIPSNFDPSSIQDEPQTLTQDRSEDHNSERDKRPMGTAIGLSYNINIVLPETSDIKVLNAIFRSVRENLMT